MVNVTPTPYKERGIDPLEAEVQRLQKLFHEHERKLRELHQQLDAAHRAYRLDNMTKAKAAGLAVNEEVLDELSRNP